MFQGRYKAVQSSDAAVLAKNQNHHRNDDHHGDIEFHQLLGDHQRSHQGRDTENEKHVENVTPHHIAQSEIRLVGRH